MTTDVINVQMSFMMIIRMEPYRGPLTMIFSFVMGFGMGGRLAMIFLVTILLLGFGLFFVIRKSYSYISQSFPQVSMPSTIPYRKMYRQCV